MLFADGRADARYQTLKGVCFFEGAYLTTGNYGYGGIPDAERRLLL